MGTTRDVTDLANGEAVEAGRHRIEVQVERVKLRHHLALVDDGLREQMADAHNVAAARLHHGALVEAVEDYHHRLT